MSLNIYRIAEVPQENRKQRIILNLSSKPDAGIACVNNITYKDTAPYSLHFDCAFPCIIKAIW